MIEIEYWHKDSQTVECILFKHWLKLSNLRSIVCEVKVDKKDDDLLLIEKIKSYDFSKILPVRTDHLISIKKSYDKNEEHVLNLFLLFHSPTL